MISGRSRHLAGDSISANAATRRAGHFRQLWFGYLLLIRRCPRTGAVRLPRKHTADRCPRAPHGQGPLCNDCCSDVGLTVWSVRLHACLLPEKICSYSQIHWMVGPLIHWQPTLILRSGWVVVLGRRKNELRILR